jgi:hypothetical protein
VESSPLQLLLAPHCSSFRGLRVLAQASRELYPSQSISPYVFVRVLVYLFTSPISFLPSLPPTAGYAYTNRVWTLAAVGIRPSLLLRMPVINHNCLLLLINTTILDAVTLFHVACRVRIRFYLLSNVTVPTRHDSTSCQSHMTTVYFGHVSCLSYIPCLKPGT